MSALVFAWRAGVGAGVSAQACGERLLAMEAEQGIIEPDAIVREAKRRTSPFHGAFDWNDKVAAAKWRKEQARQILRCLVVVEADGEAQKPVRAFVNISDEETDRRGYIETRRALVVPRTRDLVLADAEREMRSFREKYANLVELAEVLAAIDRTIGTPA